MPRQVSPDFAGQVAAEIAKPRGLPFLSGHQQKAASAELLKDREIEIPQSGKAIPAAGRVPVFIEAHGAASFGLAELGKELEPRKPAPDPSRYDGANMSAWAPCFTEQRLVVTS